MQRVLVVAQLVEREAGLPADPREHPAVDRVAAERAALLADDLRAAGQRAGGGDAHQRQVHRAAAEVDDEHVALVREGQPVAERRGHRLVEEAHAPHAELPGDRGELGAVGLERADRRGQHQLARAVPGDARDLGEQLAQEGARHLAGREGAAAEAHERAQRLALERALERRHEGRGDAACGCARAPAGRSARCARGTSGCGSAGRRPIAPEQAGLLEQVHRGGDHPRRLERVGALRRAGDRRQLEQLRRAGPLVPVARRRCSSCRCRAPRSSSS